jgi:thioredoxin 1
MMGEYMSMMELSDETFVPEVYDSQIPVLVEFYADWCKPCKALVPVLETLAEKYQGRVKICRVNIENAPHMSQQCQILSVPRMFIVNGGHIVHAFGGIPDSIESVLCSRFDELLEN